MQLYALNASHQPILARHASKQQDYVCLECHKRVRVRGGMHRQPHFYHLEPNRHCYLSGKSMSHLQAQWAIYQLLPLGECELERSFPEIKRIADVAWKDQKIVFEIQCSPISATEVLKRNADYRSLGWEVVWILHDKRYNQWRLTAAEWVLRHSPFYFTNINENGAGIIYDQFDLWQKGIRHSKLASLAIQPHRMRRKVSVVQQHCEHPFIELAQERLKKWSLFFEGDLVLSHFNADGQAYLKMARELEKADCPSRQARWFDWLKRGLYYGLIRPYYLIFQILLEKACR